MVDTNDHWQSLSDYRGQSISQYVFGDLLKGGAGQFLHHVHAPHDLEVGQIDPAVPNDLLFEFIRTELCSRRTGDDKHDGYLVQHVVLLADNSALTDETGLHDDRFNLGGRDIFDTNLFLRDASFTFSDQVAEAFARC